MPRKPHIDPHLMGNSQVDGGSVDTARGPRSVRFAGLAMLLVASMAGHATGIPLAAQSRDQAEEGVVRDLEALAGENPQLFEEAWERLLEGGAPALEAALVNWDQAGSAGRVARARLVGELTSELAGGFASAESALESGANYLGPFLAWERTPEPEARIALAAALGSPALAREGVGILAELIVSDPVGEVRAAALKALRESAEPAGAELLDALLVRMPDAERPAAARALAGLPAARSRVVRRVQEALFSDEGESDSSAEVEALRHHATLAALARGYGRALAELPLGGSTSKDRAPFLSLRNHPDTRVRAASRASLERFLLRLMALGEEQRADDFLAAIAADGLSPREVLYRRARLAMAGLGNAEAARDLAQELLRTAVADQGRDTAIERVWLHYGLVLRGAAEFALGDIEQARASFESAAGVLLGLIEERDDLRPQIFNADDHPLAPVGGATVVDHIVEMGLIEVWLSLCALGEGEAVASPKVLEPLRRAHVLVLGAQLLGQRTDSFFDVRSLDDFLDRDLGPRRLLLVSRELPGGVEGRFLDLQLLLGQALSTVVPQEVMGFERVVVEDVARYDVFRDNERFGLLKAIAYAQQESAKRAWFARRTELEARSWREDFPEYESFEHRWTEPEFQRVQGLFRRQQDAARERQAVSDEVRRDPAQREKLYPELRELRTPSLLALTLSAELRADGRSPEARALSQRMLQDLRGSTGQSALWNEWISARLELAIASAWMDEDKPDEAERSGLAAVDRLEALERSMDDLIQQAADDPGRVLGLRRQKRQFEALRADALLSLAVNANVRGKDSERALGFFERAFELDQREFMRVLLACYRARSGRVEEARAVLRGVQPAPSLYYNFACTYALLGEPDQALDFLGRELEENHPTPGALARQKNWAREDPDLRSLRGDPRFERMTEPD